MSCLDLESEEPHMDDCTLRAADSILREAVKTLKKADS